MIDESKLSKSQLAIFDFVCRTCERVKRLSEVTEKLEEKVFGQLDVNSLSPKDALMLWKMIDGSLHKNIRTLHDVSQSMVLFNVMQQMSEMAKDKSSFGSVSRLKMLVRERLIELSKGSGGESEKKVLECRDGKEITES